MNFSGGETFWRIWARSLGHTFSFSRKISGGLSRRFWDITATHVRVIYLSGNQARMIYWLRLKHVWRHNLFSFVLSYDLRHSLWTNFGLLSIMNSGRALDENGWMTWRRRRRRISDWLRDRSRDRDRHVDKGHLWRRHKNHFYGLQHADLETHNIHWRGNWLATARGRRKNKTSIPDIHWSKSTNVSYDDQSCS